MSQAIRHDVVSAQAQADLAAAQAQRDQTIGIAYQVIGAEIRRTFPWF